jgi:hypothetical protein
MLRQQHVEESFRRHLSTLGVTLHCPTECINFEVLEPDAEGYYLRATLKDVVSGSEYTVKRSDFE